MDKKKKIIIISVIAIIIIALIIGLTIFLTTKNNPNGDNTKVIEARSSQIAKLYEKLSNEEVFSFTTTLDENNKETYAKKENVAYLDTVYNGEESKYIIKDGNSYLLRDSDKVYYTYKNNEVNLNKVLEQLDAIIQTELVEGKEEINGKNYSYEEYSGLTNFTIQLTDNNNLGEVKTRFYFNGNKLAYIKTISDDMQELLKIEISDKVDDKLFEIPSDYISR